MSKKICAFLILGIMICFGAATAVKGNISLITPLYAPNVSDRTGTAEEAINENFASRYEWINFNGSVLKALNIRYVKEKSGSVVMKTDDGRLAFSAQLTDAKEKAAAVLSLKETIQKYTDSEFIYVQIPFRLKDAEILPDGAQNFAREDADAMMELLEQGGVDTLDLYTWFMENSEDYASLFFRTDHHWKPGTALTAADRICSYLHEKYGFYYAPERLVPEAYQVTTYEDLFLGAMGKRVGVSYGGADDLDLYLPKEETEFEFQAVRMDGSRIERTGSFEEALIAKEYLEKDWYELNNYYAYLGSDYAISHAVNHLAGNDTRVLLIRESFSTVLQPFLYMNYGDVTAIDLRYFSDMTLREYIMTHDFDLIMIAYNPSALLKENSFTFDQINGSYGNDWE